MTKTIETSGLSSLDLLKPQPLKETLKNSFCPSNSIFWPSISSNIQEYKEIQTKL